MITFDASQVKGLAERLAKLTPEQFGEYTVAAINETVDSAYQLGRDTILSGINLTDDYVQRKMDVERATAKNPQATITAFGGRAYITPLSHYGALQLTRDVTWSNERILAEGHRFTDWPGWTRRTGNEALGISVNQKAAGRSVEVIRGSRKDMGSAFAIPSKRDSSGTPIMFRRIKGTRKKVEALHGPSVYQLFRAAIPKIEDRVAEDLTDAVIEAAERGMEEALR